MVISKIKKALMQIFIIACIAIIIIPFAGCGFWGYYSGKHVDLYTVAVNSVLWNKGYMSHTERLTNPQIKIIEKDEFGRTLFTYYEKGYGCVSFSSLMVSQGSVDGYVYYYEDKNYLLRQENSTEKIQDFTNEEIDRLKSVNDWGKEVDLQKCTKKQIDKRKQKIPIDTEVIKEKAVAELNIVSFDETRDLSYMDYLTGDANGNFIVYGVIFTPKFEDGIRVCYAAFVNSDFEIIDWLVPSDLYNYQNDLINFKEKNGWSNQPQ